MFTRQTAVAVIILLVLLSMIAVGAVLAATSATITFDFVSDPGDLADGPDFEVTGTGLIDDGSGCGGDTVVVVMVDATGTPTDVDSFCLNLVTGTGGSDGDYGSFVTGYLPTAGPVTYAVFDIDAADLAALSGQGENSQAYFDYVVANGTFLTEGYVDVTGLTSGTPYSFMAAVVVAGPVCRLPIPAGTVVGELPHSTQVFWAPDKQSPGITLNAGTYHVIGQDATETYYKLFFACQYIWVLKDAMQPSYQAPQNGTPLPTVIVS